MVKQMYLFSDGSRTTVGTYLMDVQPNEFEWTREGIQWNGRIIMHFVI